MRALLGFYRKMIVDRPVSVLLIVVLVTGFFAFHANRFRLDASADSLLLDNDADLRFYQQAKRTFSSKQADDADEYLLMTYQASDNLFSEESITHLRALVEDLKKVPGVVNVRSILDIPLFESPKINLMQIAAMVMTGGLPTIEKPGVDKAMGQKELRDNPYAKDLIISHDGKLTALMLILARDPEAVKIARAREDLKAKKYTGGLDAAETEQLAELEVKHREASKLAAAEQARRVAAVRAVMAAHRDKASLFLGGVPMVVADMMHMVRGDLFVFGLGVMAFLILTLGLIFRRPRWVILPLLTCVLAVVFMVGLLGFFSWPATVISSNFTSLLFIITMSMAIHIVVRYRELHREQPEAEHRELVFQSACLVALPCLYCTLTTMVGFGSLVASGIQPVIDFGRMMFIGIGVAYLLCFTFFPAALMLFKKPKDPGTSSDEAPLSLLFARFTEHRTRLMVAGSLIVIVLGIWGISRLTVENRFVDYFKADTDISKGMVVIDSRFGGTTPMEIVLNGTGSNFWIQPENLAKLRRIHKYLESQSEVGKVLSLDTLIQVGEKINDGQPLNPILLGMMRTMLPEDLKSQMVRPFVTDEFDKIRIVALVRETDPNLNRVVLLGKIQNKLREEGFGGEAGRVTGLYVLYNNLLQSLFRSQILTIGFVYAAVWLMFIALFRSVKLASIAMIPNIFPVVLVLGALGLLGIPLDIMTITIAAITIGIAVDQTIHYVHRFKAEFPLLGDYTKTMYACHGSIGRAMYYTSVTIIAGFSILMLSSFMPTIYFGMFTAMAMVAALFGSLTMLPALLVWLKPLGPEAAR